MPAKITNNNTEVARGFKRAVFESGVTRRFLDAPVEVVAFVGEPVPGNELDAWHSLETRDLELESR